MSQTRPISRACNTCKTRRIKCDEERPTCQRCLRSGRQCVYATDFDRVHRDETRRTQRRFAQSDSSSTAPGTTSGSAPGTAHAQPAAARSRRRAAQQQQQQSPSVPPPTTLPVPTTTRLTPAPPASSVSPSSSYLLPVRNSASASPGSGSGTGVDGNLNLVSISARDDGRPFSMSMPGTEMTAFVAGHEVEYDVAMAAGSLSAGAESRPFWRGQGANLSTSTYFAHIYSPDDYATGASIDSGSSPETITPPRDRNMVGNRGDNGDGNDSGDDIDIQRPASTLSLPIGELAVCYFASNFMLMPRRPYGGSFFEFVVPVLRGQPPDSAVQFALRACAFSALGNRWVSETIDFRAIGISQYTAALSRTTQSLKDPKKNTTDATLAAVLLLGLFESITARKELFAWRSHTEGAIQIVQNRGTHKIRTRTEQLLFNSVRLQLINHSMSADTAPTWNINWWAGESILDSASARSQRFLLEVSQLRREQERHIMACTGKVSIEPHEFSMYILRVRAIDNEVASFLSSLPDSYKAYPLAIAGDVPGGDYENAEAFPGRVDMYPDLTIAGIWFSLRSARLVLSSSIVRCQTLTSGATDFRTTPEFAEEVRRCCGLITDLVAAIPYFLESTPSFTSSSSSAGMPPHTATARVPSPASSGFACGDDHGHGMPKVLAGLLLIWPLAGTYTHDCATPDQRAYMGGRLRYMGNTLGLRYALVCAATPFRYPSMMMYRDRLIVSGAPASSQPVLLGRGPSSSKSPSAS